MKFDIGYFQTDETGLPFRSVIDDFKDHIHSVYFPWPGMATDRAQLGRNEGYCNWDAQNALIEDLRYVKKHGIKIDLLFNANCYGAKAISVEFAKTICSIIDYILQKIGSLDCVTTTSPFIAWVVKNNYPEIPTKASVNMRVGEIRGFEQLADYFDIFYVQRDHNRNLAHLKKLCKWADSNGKQLRLLANSGCMRLCSGQIFHDSLCSHTEEINSCVNVEDFNIGLCQHIFSKPENRYKILSDTWIRPEDVHHYEGIFTSLKLATRTTYNPRLIIEAYTSQSFDGNLLELLEPNHVMRFFPTMIHNKKFPEDWFQQTSTCGFDCQSCSYCQSVYDQVTKTQ